MANLLSVVPPELLAILKETPELQQSFLVGGCVRDALLGLTPGNWDIEIFGLSYEALAGSLKKWGRGDLVGKSFVVLKLRTPSGAVYDFSLARRDSKVSPGHKGFQIIVDPAVSPEEAAGRRDFTINSLMLNVRTGELLDYFGGER